MFRFQSSITKVKVQKGEMVKHQKAFLPIDADFLQKHFVKKPIF